MAMHKVSELGGSLLDAAVAKARGEPFGACYGTDWSHGGPIIERERIDVCWEANDGPEAWRATAHPDGRLSFGPTPLIAAMRAYVGSKFGEEADLP